jgi:mRNA-degrading endonuclease RelE of RelBE toxin-antitoxin system
MIMKAVFVELPAFERHRAQYMDDNSFSDFQQALLINPRAGDVIQGTGGLRKIRFQNARKRKGKRGGLRIIYYWWHQESAFLLFTVYAKGEVENMTPEQCKTLAQHLQWLKASRRQS